MWIAKIKDLKKICKVTYLDIAKACKVPKSRVSKWFNGVAMPDTTSIDIMHEKFFSDVIAVDNLEIYFEFAYDEQHNVDGQIDIWEVNEEKISDSLDSTYKSIEETNIVVPVKIRHPKRGLINAYYDRQRELLYIQYISTDLAEAIGMTWEE
jgi:transcriptional regulator with XRE-family HTH domain